nr:hypothetical protein [Nocardia tengchongensis]
MTGHSVWKSVAASVAVGVVVAVHDGGAVANADVGAGTRPLGCVPAMSTLQVIPPFPGLFLPLPSIRGVAEFDDLSAAPAG